MITPQFKTLSFSFGLVLFLTILLPPSVPGQASLKVGGLIPMTGQWGDSGRECAKGMLDAAKWVNQRGGVFGMKLEISLIDDTSEPAGTVAAFRKLNEADKILLLYVYSTETAFALLPHIQFNRITALASSFPSHLANPVKYPYIFSINPTALDLSKIAVKFISERSGIRGRKPKIVFVGSPDLSNQFFLNETKEYTRRMGLDMGPDIWVSRHSPSPDTSKGKPSPALVMINSYNPDFVYLSLPSKEASFILQETTRMNLRTKWVGSSRAFDENLSSFNGVFGVQPIAPFGEDIPGMAEIKEAHQKWHPFDSHTLSYVEGWATIRVIEEALGRSLPEHGFSRERVKAALETFRDLVLGGLVPPLTITPMDHRPSMESRILVIKNGRISRHTEFISIER